MSETIIAVGGGGYNLAIDLKEAGLFTKAQFTVCDTDENSLKEHSEIADKSYLLERFGNQRVYANKIPMVEPVLKDSADTIIICATLGGQTGSKYAPLIALSAILKGKKVYSLLTLPFGYEGENRSKLALNAMMQIIASSNFTIRQLNDKLDGSLNIGEMNKPIIETVGNLLEELPMEKVAELNNADAQKIIPAKFVSDDKVEPLMWIRPDSYRGIQSTERCEVFDCFVK